jgi:hypothetical protein
MEKKIRGGGFMKKIMAIAAATAVLLIIPGFLMTGAQEQAAEDFSPDIESEQDAEFLESLDLLGDAELLEMLISDPGFMEVFEEFSDDIGIGEEEVPFDLLGDAGAFSKARELGGDKKAVEEMEKQQGGGR